MLGSPFLVTSLDKGSNVQGPFRPEVDGDKNLEEGMFVCLLGRLDEAEEEEEDEDSEEE